MKFTKEEAGKEITARLSKSVENINAWDRTIKENVETLWSILGEDNEIELKDFADKALPLFNTTAGFLRKTNADIAKSYEDKIKELQGKIVTPTPSPQPQPSPTPAIDEELRKRIEALELENKEAKQRILVAEKKESLTAKLKEKGVKDSKWINSLLGLVTIDDTTDIDAMATKYVDFYNSGKSTIQHNVTPGGAGGSDNYVNDTIKNAANIVKGGML